MYKGFTAKGAESAEIFSRSFFSLRSSVWSVAFSPDGQTLASGSADRTIRLWATLDVLVTIACERAGRNMSWAEWQAYLPTLPYERTCPQYPVHPSVPEDARP